MDYLSIVGSRLNYNIFEVIIMNYERLKKLREDHDLTQEEIAKVLNVKQTTYSKYELGRLSIPANALMKLADLYKTSMDYLVGRTNNPLPYEDK